MSRSQPGTRPMYAAPSRPAASQLPPAAQQPPVPVITPVNAPKPAPITQLAAASKTSIDGFKPAGKPANRLAGPGKMKLNIPGAVLNEAGIAPPLPLEPAAQPFQATTTDDDRGSLPVTPVDLNLEDTPAAARPKNRLHAAKAFRKWMLRGGLAFAVMLLLIGGLLFYQGLSKVHKVFKGSANRPAALQANVDPQLLKGEGDGRVNILLLGNGGNGHDGPDLTDTIMVASIDPVNKTADLLSVPRDLWVKMPNGFMGASQKINAAYEDGKYTYLHRQDASNANYKAVEAGFASADKVVSQ
ncbi:MAG TPA: LCP family protein, partial [Candidatus Saccharimonadales bacterium]|nr:LCP family protein [Candidatus Saccharimonadales bacterium]